MGKQKYWIYPGLVAVLLVLLIGSTGTAFAQLAVSTATLSGSVTDPSGAIIPDATINLTSPERGISRSFTADGQGHYSFSQLPPGNYTLDIQGKGFKEYVQNGIVLDAGQTATQDVHLVVGAASQKVMVTSQASVLNTENANISAEVDAKQIVELPLNLRNVYSLATLNSSVSNNSESQQLLGGGGLSNDNADQDISFLHFSGGFFGTSAYLLDGAWDTDPEWGAVVYVPSVDAVQEFKIQNNSFTAQYGWSTGNVVDVTTKSGSSSFHGDAYEFYRNSVLDANLWFSDHNKLKKQDFNRNQMGVSAGGPLYIPGVYRQRNKTFIFGLYERLSLSSPSTAAFTVPDANMRAGNFSELLGASVGTDALGRPIAAGQIYDPNSARPITAGQVDPKTGLVATSTGYIRDPIANNNVAAFMGGNFNPVGAKLVSYFPNATGPGLSNNLNVTGLNPANSDEYLVRLDQNFSDATRFNFRYSYKKESKTGEPAYFGEANPAGPGNNRPNNRWDISSGLSHIFSQNFTMNISSGVSLWHERSVSQSNGFQATTLGLPTQLNGNAEFPVVNFGGSYVNLGSTQGQALTNHGPIGSVATDFIKIAGPHTLSFGFMGVELEDDQTNIGNTTINSYGGFTDGPNPDKPTANTGNGIAQALIGVTDGGSYATPYNPATGMHYLGGYLQDDWHALPNLTLNLGIRYEVQTAPTYRHNLGSTFNPNTPNPIGTAIGQPVLGALTFLSSKNRAEYATNYGNVAPRVGFSYQATPALLFRGGYGIFYPPAVSTFQAGQDGFSANSPIVGSVNGGRNPAPGVSLTNPWPNGFVQTSGNTLGQMQDVGYGLGSIFEHRKSAYVQQYMVGAQYALGSNDSIEVDYVGNRGTHMLTGNLYRNQLDPKYLAMGATALNASVANPYSGHITSSGCGLNNPTVVQSQLLLPYSQYCAVTENDATAGFSQYNALEATYNHRFNQGLSVLVSYTYSKFVDNVEGQNSWSYRGNSGPANNYNLAAEKSVDAGDTPHSLVASYIYALPVGRGHAVGSNFNHVADAVLGGWEISGIATFKSGIPLGISGNNYNSYGGNPRPDYSGSLGVSHKSINQWFNTGAFTYAPYGSFGNAPRFFSNLRAPGYQNFDTSIDKNWALPKGMRFQLRAETYNTFNHPQFYSPNTNYGGCDPNASTSCSSQFGQITGAFPSREVQFAGKLYW